MFNLGLLRQLADVGAHVIAVDNAAGLGPLSLETRARVSAHIHTCQHVGAAAGRLLAFVSLTATTLLPCREVSGVTVLSQWPWQY